MLRFDDGLVLTVSTTIDATPRVVWDTVTDINLSARFSTEFEGAEWVGDQTASLGAAFIGRNRRGEYTWETTSWVTEFEPERRFGWSVSDQENPGATWTFEIEPQGDGTSLTYRRLLGPGPSGITRMIAREPEREHEILERRNEFQRTSMQAVVDGVKALLETDH